jgi:hypothetical protein
VAIFISGSSFKFWIKGLGIKVSSRLSAFNFQRYALSVKLSGFAFFIPFTIPPQFTGSIINS